jgi:amino acid permease
MAEYDHIKILFLLLLFIIIIIIITGTMDNVGWYILIYWTGRGKRRNSVPIR